MDNGSGFDCRFFRAGSVETRNNGECRKVAPRAMVNYLEDLNGEIPTGYAVFPRVLGTDWCGEFEVRQHKMLDLEGEEI